MIPSINDSITSFLTMINGTLVQEIGGRKILEPFAVTLYSYEILPEYSHNDDDNLSNVFSSSQIACRTKCYPL